MNNIILKNELVEPLKQELVALEKQVKLLSERQKEVKELIKNAMEEHGIETIESDEFKITYFPESESVGLDKDKLKEEHEEVYLDCITTNQKKAFIKIKLK